MAWTGNRLFQLISELSKSRIKSHLSQMFVPFEMIVLDNALRVTSTRFQHYFAKMKPIINRLLSSVSTDPCEKTLEKILAFKKSLLSFEMRYLTPYCFVSVKLIIRSSSYRKSYNWNRWFNFILHASQPTTPTKSTTALSIYKGQSPVLQRLCNGKLRLES